MPLLATPYPHVFNSLNGPSAPEHTFLIFYSIVVNGRMWCPDCVNVEPTVREAFDGENKPKAVIYWVGSLAEWRSPENKARVEYNVHNVPTILRLENGKEAARLVEDDILDERKLDAFIYPTKSDSFRPCSPTLGYLQREPIQAHTARAALEMLRQARPFETKLGNPGMSTAFSRDLPADATGDLIV